jgi:hypothetical protein
LFTLLYITIIKVIADHEPSGKKERSG